jgi:ribosomal protein S18 acetylase RimI-like enzyme
MERALEWAREQNVRRIVLGVHKDNEAARSLYASYGFREMEDPYITLEKIMDREKE